MEILVYILMALAVLLLAFLGVIIGRALAFRPQKQVPIDEREIHFDQEKSLENFRTLVRFPTISNAAPALEDDGAFEALIAALPSLYPNVFAHCSFDRLPDRALLFRLKGKKGGEPAVLMAHYDVVPVNEKDWEKPPFDAVLENGVIWGRGTLDTKITFHSVLFAADTLLKDGFVPENDVYFAFSGGEEVNGNGAKNIVSYFKENGITPAFVLDEGGAVVENVFPGVKMPCGMIGIAEKGMMNVRYSTSSNGGHASAPKPHTPVGLLSRACTRIENHPFPYHISKPAYAMFDTLGRHSSFLYRVIFANLWCFSPLLNKICKAGGGELNALLRTTVAFTQMQGSSAANVIPPEASMISNIRLNPCDNAEEALAYLRKTVSDENVKIEALYAMDPSPVSRIDVEGWQKVSAAVASTWKGSIVSPYLMMQCSDSRHYAEISDRVYRFSAMDLTKEERATIHGNNERIRVETAHRAVEFYIRLLGSC